MIATLNGYTLADLNMVAVPPFDGWLDAPLLERASEPIPEHLSHRAAPRATTGRRTLVVPVRISCPTIADRPARLALIDEALSGIVRIVRTDSPRQFLRAEYLGAEHTALTARHLHPDLLANLQFVAYDAASYDQQPTVLAIGTTPVPIPQGTLPSPGRVLWPGGWSGTRTLDYRGINGVRYGTLSVTVPGSVTFAAGEHLVLDLARWTCTRVSASGVRSNAYSWLSAGDWFAPQPRDGDRARGRWGALATSAGTVVYVHRLAWRF